MCVGYVCMCVCVSASICCFVVSELRYMYRSTPVFCCMEIYTHTAMGLRACNLYALFCILKFFLPRLIRAFR